MDVEILYGKFFDSNNDYLFSSKCNLYDAMTPIEFENHYRQIDRKFYCANTGVGITDDGN
jgi:hypothetical protein